MAHVHGKNTVIKVGTDDLTQYTDASELTEAADTHDTTTYGNDAHRYDGGLLDNKFTMSGVYDNTAATGPAAVLKPLKGKTASITRQLEGTGTGKPQEVFTAILSSFVQTAPTADMVRWSSEWTIDGEVDDTPQA
jgi:hypothetical protein